MWAASGDSQLTEEEQHSRMARLCWIIFCPLDRNRKPLLHAGRVYECLSAEARLRMGYGFCGLGLLTP